MFASATKSAAIADMRPADRPNWSRSWTVGIISDAPKASADIRDFLRPPFHGELIAASQIHATSWDDVDAVVVDAWRKTADDVASVSDLLARLSHMGKPVFVAVGPSMRLLFARMGLLAGVNTFTRPLAPETFTDVLATLLANRSDPAELRGRTREAFLSLPEHAEALTAADEALERIFALGMSPGRLDMPVIDKQSNTIIESLATSGIGGWIAGVRLHHDTTYQHCLLVTGAAIAFGHQLGFSRNDMRRIALGALFHDIGKAKVPVGILDKPSALSSGEKAIMRRHPQLGLEMLRSHPSVTDELKSIVLNHHELLDGSGYPNGLAAESISDIVRLVTVADIFGALIEKRPYKRALRGSDAYEILLSMDGKLDMAIVKAVRTTAFRAES